MKIYIASSFRFKQDVADLAGALEAKGYIITCRWWEKSFHTKDGEKPPDTEEFFSKAIIHIVGMRALKKIDESNLLILLGHPTEPHAFTGANIELGYALAKHIPVISIGRLEESCMYESIIKLKKVDELWELLEEFER